MIYAYIKDFDDIKFQGNGCKKMSTKYIKWFWQKKTGIKRLDKKRKWLEIYEDIFLDEDIKIRERQIEKCLREIKYKFLSENKFKPVSEDLFYKEK